MSTPEVYRRRAEISLREAEKATDPVARKAWSDLAKAWSDLAGSRGGADASTSPGSKT
jgi:hypothetical protein